jgi:hypothetical protein
MGIKNIKIVEQTMPKDKLSGWPSVISHTHMLRHNSLSLTKAKKNLVGWCRKFHFNAIGIGSPWEPVSAKKYNYYENEKRDYYYSDQMAPKSVMDKKEIEKLINDLNALDNDTLFYLDNETPKNRNGHMWYFGYNYDFPAWHDYCQNRPISFYRNDPNLELNTITGKPHTRRPYMEVVSTQRKKGALAIWAHPTSWWFDPCPDLGKKFITNIASELVWHLFADGFIDGMVVQGYDACQRSYQALWFALLDTGAIVPGFAENDACFDDPDLLARSHNFISRLKIPGKLTLEKIIETARRGEVFCSSGAFLSITVDGTPMGSVQQTASGKSHKVLVEAYPVAKEQSFSLLEIIGKNGTVIKSFKNFPGGIIRFDVNGSDAPKYLLARAFGENDDPYCKKQQDIHHMAITNPVYLHPPRFCFQAIKTECKIHFSPESPWRQGKLSIISPDGELIDEYNNINHTISTTVQANSKARLTKEGIPDYFFYIAMENELLQQHIKYLSSGEFLKDFPECLSGEVPVEAFHIPEIRNTLKSFEITL